MTALTFRLDDDKHLRLKQLAKSRKTTINHLLNEMTTLMLAEMDLETRYQARVVRGKGKQKEGLALLAKARK